MEQRTASDVWPPPAGTPERALYGVWCSAVDAATSKDFRGGEEGGELDETAYLRYQRATIERGLAELGRAEGVLVEVRAALESARQRIRDEPSSVRLLSCERVLVEALLALDRAERRGAR